MLYIIAQQGFSEYNPLLHLPSLAPFDPAGGLTALLLGDGTHDGQTQLRIRVHCVNAIVHKQHANPQLPQLACIGNCIQNISREPANLLGENHPKFSQVGIGNHAIKGGPLFC